MRHVFPIRRASWLLTFALLLCGLDGLWLGPLLAEGAKRPHREVRPPDLKILSVQFTPDPYTPASGPMEIAVEVELPHTVQDHALLEISSLITSPSKRSLKFLSDRQPIKQILSAPAGPTANGQDSKHHVSLLLKWDGKDQTKQLVQTGRYDYEVRAKLLEVNDKGPRTHMVAWPKRGVLEVR
jgi:hypothetical protein